MLASLRLTQRRRASSGAAMSNCGAAHRLLALDSLKPATRVLLRRLRFGSLVSSVSLRLAVRPHGQNVRPGSFASSLCHCRPSSGSGCAEPEPGTAATRSKAATANEFKASLSQFSLYVTCSAVILQLWFAFKSRKVFCLL